MCFARGLCRFLLVFEDFDFWGLLFLVVSMTNQTFFNWVFDRHHNQWSWYIRILYIYCVNKTLSEIASPHKMSFKFEMQFAYYEKGGQ